MGVDREKVIKALKMCIQKSKCYMDRPDEKCPYNDWIGKYEDSYYECTSLLAKDALALLKEQDATIKRQQDVIDIMASEQYDDYPFFNDGKGE